MLPLLRLTIRVTIYCDLFPDVINKSIELFQAFLFCLENIFRHCMLYSFVYFLG